MASVVCYLGTSWVCSLPTACCEQSTQSLSFPTQAHLTYLLGLPAYEFCRDFSSFS